MKTFILSAILLASVNTYSKSLTVSIEYEYQIDYKKISAQVVCVETYNSEAESNYDTRIYFSPATYGKTVELTKQGYEPTLNGNKGEQCDTLHTPGSGSTPLVSVFSPSGKISKKSVLAAMEEKKIKFVKRDVLFKKTTFSNEILEENISTVEDDLLYDVWNKKNEN